MDDDQWSDRSAVTSGYFLIMRNNGSFSLKTYIYAYFLLVTQ
jgi:hypothetical protein